MKVIRNSRLIQRNRRIGQIATIIALVILGFGLYISFAHPEQYTLSLTALIVGFVLSQAGIYFGNRWGRSPRPDELLTNALKGLEDKYALYHYVSGIPHMLIGPAGIWALIPVTVAGTITYDPNKRRFRQKGGNLYLKIFGQENLGRPDLEAAYAVEDLNKFLKKTLGDANPFPTPKAILVFTNPKASLEIEESPIPAVPLAKLKEFVRRQAKESPAPAALIQELQKALPNEKWEGR
ncbi:hypothetical protein [uncultured Thermanaerothrix sp.]|uniref:hypothetical protein n=1 Tax=uncultured Thermanaerothrix sp. TaxID=1195149 RepID=UPI0026119E01|nr:hypothetical protein [uncultured Thermanaerothrix sp.]